MPPIQVYRNGDWIDSTALSVSVDDLGFLLGVTVVERLRTFGGKPFRIDEHVARLRRSLEIVGWDAVRLTRQAESAIREFVERNRPLIDPGDDWTISIFVTPGATPDARRPTLCVHGHPLPFASWADQFESGVSAVLSDVRQIPENCWPPELKCRSRMHYYLADRRANARQHGGRAILLDQQGYVSEESTANVVAYSAAEGIFTPRLSHVLPGISQQVVFELAEQLGIRHQHRDVAPEQLAAADEVMLTSTSICVLPVVRLDAQPIGDGQPGPVYRKLLSAWGEAVGVDVAAQAARFAHRPAK